MLLANSIIVCESCKCCMAGEHKKYLIGVAAGLGHSHFQFISLAILFRRNLFVKLASTCMFLKLIYFVDLKLACIGWFYDRGFMMFV